MRTAGGQNRRCFFLWAGQGADALCSEMVRGLPGWGWGWGEPQGEGQGVPSQPAPPRQAWELSRVIKEGLLACSRVQLTALGSFQLKAAIPWKLLRPCPQNFRSLIPSPRRRQFLSCHQSSVPLVLSNRWLRTQDAPPPPPHLEDVPTDPLTPVRPLPPSLLRANAE